MTPKQLASYVRLKTKTNSNTFPDDDLLLLLNVVKNDYCDRALEVDEDIFEVPTTLDLVLNRREYPLASDILSRISRVEADFIGDGSFIKLNNKDLTDFDFPISNEALITSRFSNLQGGAFYDIMRKSVWIYSGTIIEVTDGLKIWLNTRPANIASVNLTTDMSNDPSTTTHGVPRALHKVIATGVIVEYKESQEKPIPLTQQEQNVESALDKAIITLKKSDYDKEYMASVPTGHVPPEEIGDGSNL